MHCERSSHHNAIGDDWIAKTALAGNCTADNQSADTFPGACVEMQPSEAADSITDVGLVRGILTAVRSFSNRLATFLPRVNPMEESR
jgi:hypothetical protein